jgi:hypothetical protein
MSWNTCLVTFNGLFGCQARINPRMWEKLVEHRQPGPVGGCCRPLWVGHLKRMLAWSGLYNI